MNQAAPKTVDVLSEDDRARGAWVLWSGGGFDTTEIAALLQISEVEAHRLVDKGRAQVRPPAAIEMRR